MQTERYNMIEAPSPTVICLLLTILIQRIHSFAPPPRPFPVFTHYSSVLGDDDYQQQQQQQHLHEAETITDIKNARTYHHIYQIIINAAEAREQDSVPNSGDNYVGLPESNIPPNIAAAALKKIIVIRNTNHAQQEEDLSTQLIPRLLANIQNAIYNNEPLSNYALSGTLTSLARIQTSTIATPNSTHNNLDTSTFMDLAKHISTCLEAQLPEVSLSIYSRKFIPTRLVGILDAMRVLKISSTKIMLGFCTRLSHSGTFGRLTPTDLVKLLWILPGSDEHTAEFMDNHDTHNKKIQLLTMVMKRLGKQTVYTQLTMKEIMLVFRGAVHITRSTSQRTSNDANGMAYNILRRGLIRPRGYYNANITLVDSMTGGQVATVLHTMETFQFKNCDDVLDRICKRLTNNETLINTMDYELAILLSNMRQLNLVNYPDAVASIGRTFLDHCRLSTVEHQSVASILRSAIHLQGHNQTIMAPYLEGMVHLIHDNAYLAQTTETDLATMVWFLSKVDTGQTHADTMFRMGERVRRRALDVYNFSPETLSMILRFAVLRFGHNQTVMEPFIKAAKYLILADFILDRCDDQELRDLVWFAARVKWDDELVVSALAKRALEPDLLEDCSSSAACSLLSSFTALAPRIGSDQYDELLSQLFNVLGTHLLSNDLNHREVADAMYTYAKTCYIFDMGIFDHLANLLAIQHEKCSVRDLANGLWACGKMYALEAPTLRTTEGEAPPYLTCAREYARRLIQRSDELLPQDVAQSIWAIGSLAIKEQGIVGPLAHRAIAITPDCNSQEIANMLWGLSKVGYSNVTVVRTLSARIRSPDLLPTTQEASNILYALGRLHIDDEATFIVLSQLIMDQLHNCTAQGIANALWAFEELGLKPPTQLLERWAVEKLGMVAFVHGIGDRIIPSLAALPEEQMNGVYAENDEIFNDMLQAQHN